MSNSVEQVRKTQVNKILRAKATIFAIEPAHFPPIVVSICIGLSISAAFDLSYTQAFLHCAWPFAAWLVAVGNKPGRFIAHFSPVPYFRRKRAKRINIWK